VWRICPPSEPVPEIYELLNTTLDLLSRHQSIHTLVFWFELKILQATGLAPQLQQCPVCGKRTLDQEGAVRLALARGGVLCEKCSAGDDFHIFPLAPDAFRIMRTLQNAETPQIALRLTCSPRQQITISRVLGGFLEHHLESTPVSRDIAFGLMNTTVPGAVTH
jgi:DNA repair protein RecO (recombination protein O)